MADSYTILAKSSKTENEGLSKHFTNRKVLADFTGISYNTLTDHFVRKRQTWHYYEEEGILVIRVTSTEKGRQRVQKIDPGDYRNI